MDWSFDSVGQVLEKGLGFYNSYTEQQTANDIAREQAKAQWEASNTQNQIALSNAKLMLIGGVILAIGTAFFIFFRK